MKAEAQHLTELELEAALCAWEAVNDMTLFNDRCFPPLMAYREDHGTPTLRSEMLEVARVVLKVYAEGAPQTQIDAARAKAWSIDVMRDLEEMNGKCDD